jgi:hypothetical protein
MLCHLFLLLRRLTAAEVSVMQLEQSRRADDLQRPFQARQRAEAGAQDFVALDDAGESLCEEGGLKWAAEAEGALSAERGGCVRAQTPESVLLW